MQAGHRALSHGGEVSGFTAQNIVFPDDGAAIVVLTNQDAASASGDIANAIAPLLFATTDPATPAKLEQAKKIFDGLAARNDRPLVVHRQRQRLFQRTGAEGFCRRHSGRSERRNRSCR